MSARSFLADRSGASAFELALLLPLLLVLLFGGMEAGHFIWTQHKLTEGVRDGARFAARLPVESYCIAGAPVTGADTIAAIRRVTRTGQLEPGGHVRVPGWSDEEVDVEVACAAFVDTGIYHDLDTAGPIVTVAARSVAYPSLFGELGVLDPDLTMTARSSSAVTGL
ncbi:hypothetical protein GCM10009127_12240 [Alteraurantiacibacter aestuarii]|uniref:Pilus assembly protein TadE n=1 Tax=Alteraurantiacibacter aestuarii TaxID=650004 RepID=A0A844ZPQ1_9SPHN|nr:pilus assembly protein TadE [Alteraurantiacibacter aestuarii]